MAKRKLHTIEGFERDVLPALRKKGVYLSRFGSYGKNIQTRNLCLLGAIAASSPGYRPFVTKHSAFTNSQLEALEAGYEDYNSECYTEEKYYYDLGKAIREKYANKW